MPDKLVRDRIPEIMRAEGVEPKVWQAPDSIYRDALLDKLVEEAMEARAAVGADALSEELADVLEVFAAILTYREMSWARISQLSSGKQKERGGFRERWMLTTPDEGQTDEQRIVELEATVKNLRGGLSAIAYLDPPDFPTAARRWARQALDGKPGEYTVVETPEFAAQFEALRHKDDHGS